MVNMRECIWHQYYYKNWKWRILFNLFKIIALHRGEVWTNYGTIRGRSTEFKDVVFEIEINKSDMGRTELLVIKEY